MSEVADSAKAKLLLDELNHRTRLLKLVRGEPGSFFPWLLVPLFLVGFGLMIWPWAIPEGVGEAVFVLVFVFTAMGQIDADGRKLRKRFDALVKVLEQDGVLQDKRPGGRK